MTGPSVGEVLGLAARLIEAHHASCASAEAVRADVTETTLDAYQQADRVWQGALAEFVALPSAHLLALAAGQAQASDEEG